MRWPDLAYLADLRLPGLAYLADLRLPGLAYLADLRLPGLAYLADLRLPGLLRLADFCLQSWFKVPERFCQLVILSLGDFEFYCGWLFCRQIVFCLAAILPAAILS